MHAFTFFHIALFLCVRWVIQEAHWMQPSVQLIRLKTLAPMHQTTWQHMDLSPGEQLIRLKPLLPVHQRNLTHSYIDIFWCISMYPHIYISIYHYIYTSMYSSPHCLHPTWKIATRVSEQIRRQQMKNENNIQHHQKNRQLIECTLGWPSRNSWGPCTCLS